MSSPNTGESARNLSTLSKQALCHTNSRIVRRRTVVKCLYSYVLYAQIKIVGVSISLQTGFMASFIGGKTLGERGKSNGFQEEVKNTQQSKGVTSYVSIIPNPVQHEQVFPINNPKVYPAHVILAALIPMSLTRLLK